MEKKILYHIGLYGFRKLITEEDFLQELENLTF